MEKMKLLLSIVDSDSENKLTDMYVKNHVPYNILTHGQGTASSDILDYLGIGETRKGVVFSIVAEGQINHIIGLLKKEMDFDKPGMGVAFTIPLSCISSILTKLDKNQMDLSRKDCEEIVMKKERSHELIIIVVAQGHSEIAMDAAKKAGANGGTVIHARGAGSSELAKFYEITIQPEKELIMLVTAIQNKVKIMTAVNEALGNHNDSKGIMFSLPIDETVGLGTDIPGFCE
ncbi:P-II family nitrogen regulator [Anaerocolumna chitinilytica]|uniref:Nitrogen regulatory protein P-II n=1 Tax=Anaerocolumna chitinilytica TaxID=1727145 RepID=A0A7I8DM48_9FIRM|nr:hypothetical protein [Anaerocolumna chitinilytica]BCJ99450.1 nitrogen regulatory protein P-II [Anaerocolumna chitinilytica]